MAKWARVNLKEDSQIIEIIDYNPKEVINEAFWDLFKECPEEVGRGYWYDPVKDTFYLPDGFAKHPDFENNGYVPIDGRSVDENGFIIIEESEEATI